LLKFILAPFIAITDYTWQKVTADVV